MAKIIKDTLGVWIIELRCARSGGRYIPETGTEQQWTVKDAILQLNPGAIVRVMRLDPTTFAVEDVTLDASIIIAEYLHDVSPMIWSSDLIDFACKTHIGLGIMRDASRLWRSYEDYGVEI